MCLFTKWRKPRIAKKDIVVYKLLVHEPIFNEFNKQVSYKIRSIHTRYEWTIGEVHHAKDTLENTMHTLSVWKSTRLLGYNAVHEGLHAYLNKPKERLFQLKPSHTDWYLLIIPKGTEYIKSARDKEIVALKMKLIGKVYV